MKDYLKQYINNPKFSDIGGKEVSKVSKGSDAFIDTRRGEVSKVSKAPFDTFDTGRGVGCTENPATDTAAAVAPLAPACPVCGGAVKVEDTDHYSYASCAANPTDYFKAVNKRPGAPMGLFAEERHNDKCVDCQTVTTTYNHRCADCLARWCEAGIDDGGEG